MRIVQPSSFRKDIKKQKKRGKDLSKLKVVVDLLITREDLPAHFADHALTGKTRMKRFQLKQACP
jgi:mRNA interferase YafQ